MARDNSYAKIDDFVGKYPKLKFQLLNNPEIKQWAVVRYMPQIMTACFALALMLNLLMLAVGGASLHGHGGLRRRGGAVCRCGITCVHRPPRCMLLTMRERARMSCSATQLHHRSGCSPYHASCGLYSG